MSKRREREKEREIRFSRALVLHRNNSTIRKTYVYIVYYEVKTKKHITLGPSSCTAKFFCPLFSSPMHILLPRRRERNLSGKKASFQPVTRMDRLPSVRSLYRGLLISNDLLLGVTSCFSRQKEKGGGEGGGERRNGLLLRSSIDAPSLLYLSSSCWRAIRLLLGLLLSSSDAWFVVFPSASPETRQGKARGGTDAAISPSSRAISSTTVSNGQVGDANPLFLFLPLLLHSVAAIVANSSFSFLRAKEYLHDSRILVQIR